MFATIPYTTFPTLELGPLSLHTFGLLVAAGIFIGAWVAARFAEQWDVPRDETYSLAFRMVLAGLIGSRVTWVASHWDEIDSPLDIFAVWKGGIQFSGGFIAALIFGAPSFMKWKGVYRRHRIDGYSYGLVLGMVIGRIGCYAVGEHFGRSSTFFGAVRYEGGETQEAIPIPGGATIPSSDPSAIGRSFHNTALYELVHLGVLFVLLWFLQRRFQIQSKVPGAITAIFVTWYGLGRFLTDSTRVSDARTLGLTGAQWMSALMVPVGLWLITRSIKTARSPQVINNEDEPADDPVDVDKADELDGEPNPISSVDLDSEESTTDDAEPVSEVAADHPDPDHPDADDLGLDDDLGLEDNPVQVESDVVGLDEADRPSVDEDDDESGSSAVDDPADDSARSDQLG